MRIGETRLFAGDIMVNPVSMQQNKGVALLPFQRGQNESSDRIAEKKKQARQQAMGLVKSAFEADKSIDDDLAARANKIQASKDEIAKAKEGLKEIAANKEELKKEYGITPDSQEQKDLELLEKRRDSLKIDSKIELTKEERERLAVIDEQGMTEYQKRSLEQDSYGGVFEKTINEETKTILEEQIVMREIGLNRLKSDPMVEASRQAEDVMLAAGKEIIGMVLQDGKEKVDEDMAEVKEKLDAAKEEQEEKEEQIEKIQERADEVEAMYDRQKKEHEKNKVELPDYVTERLLELDAVKSDVQQEVDKMLTEMKLLAEDLKGSTVDMPA